MSKNTLTLKYTAPTFALIFEFVELQYNYFQNLNVREMTVWHAKTKRRYVNQNHFKTDPSLHQQHFSRKNKKEK